MSQPPSSLQRHQPGDIVSVAIRYSSRDIYKEQVIVHRATYHDTSQYDPQQSSYSFAVPNSNSSKDSTELLLVYQGNNYPTDDTIPYKLLDNKTYTGFYISYIKLKAKSEYTGVESPGASIPGVGDNRNGTYRAVLLHETGLREELEGVIINPPVPFYTVKYNGTDFITPVGIGGVLLALGLGLWLFLKRRSAIQPIVQGKSR